MRLLYVSPMGQRPESWAERLAEEAHLFGPTDSGSRFRPRVGLCRGEGSPRWYPCCGPNKINWRRLVAEAAAIALGVFFSLWADEWRTSRWEASEGRAALLRIAADLEKDTLGLAAMSERAQRQVRAIREILTADPEAPGTPAAIAERLPDVVVSSMTTVSRSAYDALVSSGRLGLVDDPDLLADLATFYSQIDYLVAISEEEGEQRRLLAALLYPHVDWPRDEFLTSGGPRFLPTPSARPSIVGLLSDGQFVGQMAHMGTLKEIKAELPDADLFGTGAAA